MLTNRLKILRITVVVILALLVLQYELGIAVIMSDPAAISPFAFSVSRILDALNKVGGLALPHTLLGALLLILSVVNLIMSLTSEVRPVQIFGLLSFLDIAVATGGGLLFVLSGFQNDHASHAMATNFILAFTFYFLELYFLKPYATNN